MRNRMSVAAREKIVNSVRTRLSQLAKRRSSGTVSADDVHRLLDQTGVAKRQPNVRLGFVRSVLREPTFEYAGEARSTRPAARGRMISEWALA